jgi:hypothetical protein
MNVTITVCGRSAFLSPVPDVIKDVVALRYVPRATSGGIRLGTERLPLTECHRGWDTPEVKFNLTLLPAVLRALKFAGHDVKITGRGPAPLNAPNAEALERLPVIDRSLLEAVRPWHGGVVRCSLEVDLTLLIAQVAVAWPDQKLAVVVETVDDTRRLRDRLWALGVDAVAVSTRNDPAKVGQVAVTTPYGLAHTEVRLSWLDIVLVPEAQRVAHKRMLLALPHTIRAKRIGFLPINIELSPFESDLVRNVFGFYEWTVPGHGLRERPVAVYRGRVVGQKLGAVEGVDLLRAGVWRNGLRNRRVAQIARALRSGDAAAADRLLLGKLPAELTGGVVVVVANVEQLLSVAERLKGWPLVAGDDADLTGLSREQRSKLRQPINPFHVGPFSAVVTAAALSRLGLADVGAIVRADGGAGPLAITPDQLAEPDAGPVRPLALVDLLDHHPDLLRQSLSRLDGYRRRGWLAPGANPLWERVDRFLQSRRGRQEARHGL